MRILLKTALWAVVFALGLSSLSAYIVADTFFIEEVYEAPVMTRDPSITRPTAAKTTATTDATLSSESTQETASTDTAYSQLTETGTSTDYYTETAPAATATTPEQKTDAPEVTTATKETDAQISADTTVKITLPTPGKATASTTAMATTPTTARVTTPTTARVTTPTTARVTMPTTVRTTVRTTARPTTPTTARTTATTVRTTKATLPTTTTRATTTTKPTVPTTTAPPAVYPILTDNYYKDQNIEIKIDTHNVVNKKNVSTRVFAVDIKLSNVEYLQTALAKNTYGKNIKETTTEMAEAHDAIFAVNGDFYGYTDRFYDDGYMMRNYVAYCVDPRGSGSSNDDALVFYDDGRMEMIDENSVSMQTLVNNFAYQIFRFGPRLVENNNIMVSSGTEVDQSASSNQRVAIGMVAPLHYIITVSEGRLKTNDGLSLYEMAEFIRSLGCATAYNLDGGTSATLYFNGEVINKLSKSERDVSDIIFINGKKYNEN